MWLTYRDTSPVLRTIEIGAQPGDYRLDDVLHRLDVQDNISFRTIDTRTGTLIPQPKTFVRMIGVPLIDHRSGHLFDVENVPGVLLMADVGSGTRRERSQCPGKET